MSTLLALTAAALLATAQENTKTQARFEELARDLKYFPTGEFVYGRSSKLDRMLPDKWKDLWYAVQTEISSPRHAVADLTALLKHRDPKVRTLALAALFQRDDPRLLPHFAGLMKDEEKTVPDLAIMRAVMAFEEKEPLSQDFHPQTVGKVATALVNWWLQPAGLDARNFDAYWAARKDRTFCASWFLARLARAAQGQSNFDKSRAPLIRAVRKEVDALPTADRDWTLLWLAARFQSASEEPGQIFATPKELLKAAKNLGPDRLMDLIQDKDISTDPDLVAKDPRAYGRFGLAVWVLRHAGQLLRAEDAPALLIAEKTAPASPWFALAAAELQPAEASKRLRAAMGRFAGKYSDQAWSRAELAAGLWRIVGESETDYLADWFYGEKVDKNPHTTQTEIFLERIKGTRAPADQKLVAHLISDPRLDKLDYQTLRVLVETVNGWMKAPLVDPNDLRPHWEKGGWGPETSLDEMILQQWRTKLRASVGR